MCTVSEHQRGTAKDLEGAHVPGTATPCPGTVLCGPGSRRELRAWPTLGSLLLATSCFIGYLDRRPKGWKIPSKTTLLISWLQTRRPNPPYQPPGCVLRVPALGPGFFISYERPYCTAGPRGCFLSIPPFPSILPFLHNVGPLGAES